MNGIHGSDTVVMEIGGKRVEEEGEESRAVQISDAKIIDLHFIGFYFFPGTQNTLTRRRIYNHFSHSNVAHRGRDPASLAGTHPKSIIFVQARFHHFVLVR